MIEIIRGAPVNGRTIERIHFYNATGIVFTIHRAMPEVGHNYRNKLDVWRIPAPDGAKIRDARKVAFGKGDVFTTKTSNGRYTGDTGKCELYVPAAGIIVETFEHVNQHTDGTRRDYMPTARAYIWGRKEPERFIPDDIMAEIEKEYGTDRDAWDRSVTTDLWHRVDHHPTRGWRPGPELCGELVELPCGTYSRCVSSPRLAAIEALAKAIAKDDYNTRKVLEAIVGNPDHMRTLQRIAKLRDFETEGE